MIANLPSLLRAMVRDPRESLVALCTFSDGRYLQFWVQSTAYVVVEVCANGNVPGARQLSESDEAVLSSIGFHAPRGTQSPNWWRLTALPDGVDDLAYDIGFVVHGVLREWLDKDVVVTTFAPSIAPIAT